MPKVPYVTLSILLVICLTNNMDTLFSFLVYDRSAITEGELWRLFTGHMIHFSKVHFGYDVLAFTILAGGLEAKHGHQQLSSLLLSLALVISTALYLTAPEMLFYGGLSGLNYGMFTYLLVLFLMESRGYTSKHHIIVALGLFILMGVRIFMQAWSMSSLDLTAQLDSHAVVAWQAHLAGVLVALGLIMYARPYKKVLYLDKLRD